MGTLFLVILLAQKYCCRSREDKDDSGFEQNWFSMILLKSEEDMIDSAPSPGWSNSPSFSCHCDTRPGQVHRPSCEDQMSWGTCEEPTAGWHQSDLLTLPVLASLDPRRASLSFEPVRFSAFKCCKHSSYARPSSCLGLPVTIPMFSHCPWKYTFQCYSIE